MFIEETWTTTKYCSTRKGGTCEPQTYGMSQTAEIYAPALQPGDWYLVQVWGKTKNGDKIELATIIVKR